jgi:mannose/fructose/N-acetylgalactosamine-specific phosphotransferase system component IID
MLQADPELPRMDNVKGRILWRSFFLETLWNFEKMQNVGFSFCIYPALERLYPGEQERKQAVARHLDTVNTHPAMGPLLAGLTARLEHDLPPSTIIPYRKRVMSALAARGDRIFWGHIRPLAAVVGVALSLCFQDSFAGSLALLFIYNLPHVGVRTLGFGKGWREGLAVLRSLNAARVETAVRMMRRAISLVLGMVTGILVVAAGQSETPIRWDQIKVDVVLCLFILTVGAFLLMRKDVSLSILIYPATLAAMAVFVVLNS